MDPSTEADPHLPLQGRRQSTMEGSARKYRQYRNGYQLTHTFWSGSRQSDSLLVILSLATWLLALLRPLPLGQNFEVETCP